MPRSNFRLIHFSPSDLRRLSDKPIASTNAASISAGVRLERTVPEKPQSRVQTRLEHKIVGRPMGSQWRFRSSTDRVKQHL
jgi:hypothetical protein